MKRVFSFLLVLLMLASTVALFACSDKYYDEVDPVGDEDEIIFTCKYGDVRYDLFRSFYLTYKNGGYSHEDSARMAIDNSVDVLAVFALCEEMDIDTESSEIYQKVDDIIVACVDGGTVDGVAYPGYGSFEKYLEALKGLYLTDRVNRLIIRYAICEQMLADKYKTALAPSDGDVRTYFNSSDCIRITWFVSEYRESASAAYNELSTDMTENQITNTFVKYSLATIAAESQKKGWYIGRYETTQELKNVADTAFSLNEGQYSNVLLGGDGNYYIVYRMAKVSSYIDTNIGEIRESYAANSMGKRLEELRIEARSGAQYKDFYNQIMANEGISM